jgi:hypothetical protein
MEMNNYYGFYPTPGRDQSRGYAHLYAAVFC